MVWEEIQESMVGQSYAAAIAAMSPPVVTGPGFDRSSILDASFGRTGKCLLDYQADSGKNSARTCRGHGAGWKARSGIILAVTRKHAAGSTAVNDATIVGVSKHRRGSRRLATHVGAN